MYGISKKSQKFKELFGGIKIYPYICIKKWIYAHNTLSVQEEFIEKWHEHMDDNDE